MVVVHPLAMRGEYQWERWHIGAQAELRGQWFTHIPERDPGVVSYLNGSGPFGCQYDEGWWNVEK